VEEAAGTWNAVPNVGFSFDFQGEANANYDTTTCSSYTYNGVFERDWVSFGLTLWCYKANGNLEHIALLFQSGSDAFWDISPEDTGTHQFKSVAVHEMGHATGFGAGSDWPGGSNLEHFVPASEPTGICWDDATVHTMCSGDSGGLPIDGRFITLEGDDEETFENGYRPRLSDDCGAAVAPVLDLA
jgi:hypothetical protein